MSTAATSIDLLYQNTTGATSGKRALAVTVLTGAAYGTPKSSKSSDYDPLDNLPDELKAAPQWFVWRSEDHGEPKPRKIPYTPRGGGRASVSNPTTWTSYDVAWQASQRGNFTGLGFVFTEADPFVGIDLDKCRDPQTGRIEPWAGEIAERLDSYTEVSPSGTGLHIILRATLPDGGNRRGHIEMYDRGRFFCVTGEHLGGTPTTIEERTTELLAVHVEIFGEQAKPPPEPTPGRESANGHTNPMSDEEILLLAQRATNGEKFDRLWAGDWKTAGYGSQSEADLALCSLIAFYAGPDIVRIDRLFQQSALCRKKWITRHGDITYGERTIKKALVDMKEFYGKGNGQATGDAPTTDWKDVEAENSWYAEQERPIEEEPAPESTAVWECPAHLWRGPFERVANVLEKQTWEVWVGTLAALAARAHRNLNFQYHRPLYGMVYALLVKPTGMGKGLATDICHDLMPEWYIVRDAVQSGPALAPILAEIARDKKGRVESVTSRPALLLIEEFTTLLKNANIQHSTLVDVLNNLFHRRWPWNISRSDRPNSGGGDVVIKDPTLTILATTTASLLKEHVSERMIRGGFLNRYLVLPGSTTLWKFYDPDGAGVETGRLHGLLDDINPHPFGLGQNVWLAYTDDARERLVQWGEREIEPIMNSAEIEAETRKRLHMYAHLIALLYAWGEQTPTVTLAHVECSISVIETSSSFLQALMREGEDPEIPKFKSYEINLEQKIIAKVQAKPGITRRGVIQVIAGKKATSADVGGMIQKLLAVGRLVERKGGANNPARCLYRPEDAPRGN